VADVSGTLEVTFDASGAAEAGRRGRVVAVVDVVDFSTSAEAALQERAAMVLGAAPVGVSPPVEVRPEDAGTLAALEAARLGTSVVVIAEPRIGSEEDRAARAAAVLKPLAEAGVAYQVVPNQGAEVVHLARFEGAVVVVVSATGGTAFDAAITAGAPAACFATTARVFGHTGWEVARQGAERAAHLALRHGTGLTVVAASANSADDALAAWAIARTVIEGGFLR